MDSFDSLKTSAVIKMWLVDFPIDCDCIRYLKQYVRKVCFNIQFKVPLLNELTSLPALKKDTPTYMNKEGIIFLRRSGMGRPNQTYRYTEIYTHQPVKKFVMPLSNVNSILFSYYPHYILEIHLPHLSQYTMIRIDGNQPCYKCSNYYYKVNNDVTITLY